MIRAGTVRADQRLVDLGLAADLKTAASLLMGGRVSMGAGGQRVTKPGTLVDTDAALSVREAEHPYVSRGGVKLAHGLDHFEVDPTGRVCLDLGCGTGGFTDVLLRRGARRVYVVDVGYGVLCWSLRQDPRVVVCERTHARDVDAELVPEPVSLLVADISFNGLGRVLPPVLPRLAHDAELVLLVKPQFEVAASEVEPGGVVTDPALHERICSEAIEALRLLGLEVKGPIDSPIRGQSAKNREFLLYGRRTWPHVSLQSRSL